MRIRKNLLRLLSFLLILIFCAKPVVYASDFKNTETQNPIIVEETIMDLERNENGDFDGTISIPNPDGLGATVFTCALVGYKQGIENYYSVYIKWYGTDSVNRIKASNLKITSTDMLFPKTYFSKEFAYNTGSVVSGMVEIGSCVIPWEVKKVSISATGFQAYFNTGGWLSFPFPKQTISVN